MSVDSTARGLAAEALAALTGGTSALSASSLALGGATIGSNALAVTGTALFNTSIAVGGTNIVLDASGYIYCNQIYNWGNYQFQTNAATFGYSDLKLARDAANTLAQVNSTNPNTFRVYNTSSFSNANYERGVFDWITTTNVLTIGTQYGGTGTFLRPVSIVGANLSLFGASGSFGSGTGVIFIANDSADPSSNPTGGGVLYVSAGALKYRGSSGTVTTLGNA